MSLAPSSAAWRMIELTIRTIGALGDPVLLLEVGGDRPGVPLDLLGVLELADRVRDAAEPLVLDDDLVARGDAEGELVTGRESELVHRPHVAGVGDGDVEDVVLVEPVRQRHGALEDVQGDEAAGLVRDPGELQVDQRQAVARGEHARDALAGGEALGGQRLGEGSAGGPAADEREPVGGDEAGRGDQVGDELDGRVPPRPPPSPRAGGSEVVSSSVVTGPRVGSSGSISLKRGIGSERRGLDPASG